MPYLKKITRAGKSVFVDLCYSTRWHAPNTGRGERMKDTSLAQEIVNARKTERDVAVMLNASFFPGDFHIVLTYKYGSRPATPEQGRADLRKWLQSMRSLAKKAEIPFRYIAGTEVGSRGGIHHHVIVNRISRDWICDLWEHGQVHFGRNLDETGEWSKLAAYIVKCKTQWKKMKCRGRAWSSSRNLSRPEPEVEVISERGHYRENPRPWKGYYVDKEKTRRGIHEQTGWGYLSYIMVRYPETERRIEPPGKSPPGKEEST